MLPSTLRVILASLLLLAGLACIAPAASANFVVVGTDPAGDSIDPDPGRDIVKVALAYNRRTGHIRAGVMRRGAPNDAAPANLTIFAGRSTATGCNAYPAIGFGTQTDMRGADWVLLRSSVAPAITGPANKLYSDAAEEYEATAKSLAGKRPDCVIAQLNEPGNSALVYDVAGPYKLRTLPELEARVVAAPTLFKPNRTGKIRVMISNPGDAPTGRVRLAAGKARGMKVQMPRRIPSLRPGARRTVTLRVTLNRRARTSTDLKVTAVANRGPRTTAEKELYLLKLPQRPKGGGGGGGDEPNTKLCFRYTWLPPYSTLVPC